MKTFSQFVAESANTTTKSHHAEANKIVTKHAGHEGTDHDGYTYDGQKLHSHGVAAHHVGQLHVDLKKAGFHKHEGDNHRPYGGSNNYPPEHKQAHYHKYTKGKTTVLVANHENHDTGHVTEVHTPTGKKD